jgi:outer membrane protein OmpA-like peptidoglycan-associated protein
MARGAKRSVIRRTAAAAIAALLVCGTGVARAESGTFNLHLNLGMALTAPTAVGGVGNVGFDWQLLPPFALDITLGGGYLDSVPSGIGAPRGGGTFNVAAGVRVRFLDNRQGYLNDPGGDRWGNLYLVPRLGYLLTAGGDLATSLFTVDAELGYEFSVARPMQIGVFVKPGVAFGSTVLGYFLTGVELSFEFVDAPVWDSDGDGLSNERELLHYHTSAYRADSDGGGVPDGTEVARGTDPLNPADDPTHIIHTLPLPPPMDPDLDKDGVANADDACPGTPAGTPVDAHGCAVLDPQLVVEGVGFDSNSTEMEAGSEAALARLVALLDDNLSARIEIGGYTDNRGGRHHNQKLSRARAQVVADWLVAHGIDAARLEVKGYGASHPKVPNDSPEHRAENRRIELKRLP